MPIANLELPNRSFFAQNGLRSHRFIDGACIALWEVVQGQVQGVPLVSLTITGNIMNKHPQLRFHSIILLGVLGMGSFAAPWLHGQSFTIFELTNHVWKFDQTNDWYTPTGLGWTTREFDDSGPSWQSGKPLLSSDTAVEIVPLRNTILRDFRQRVPPNTALYARTHFEWVGPVSPNVRLSLAIRVDDGCVVYLNGNRVGDLRIPDTVGDQTFAEALVPCLSANGNNDGTCDEFLTFDGTFLRTGDNVLAVSVHQNNNSSSDLTWGCRLDAAIPFAPVINNPAEPADRTVLQARPTTFVVNASGFPNPTYQWFHDQVPIPNATNASYAIARFDFPDAGQYYCHVSNSEGNVDSRIATANIIADIDPPSIVQATADETFRKVVVQFSEAVDEETAIDPFLYVVTDDAGTEYGIGTAAVNPGGESVTLTLGAMSGVLPEGVLLTLTIDGVLDVALNPLPSFASVSFRSWVRSDCTGVLFEAYDGITGTALNLLTSSPNFPDNPSLVGRINRFHTRAIYGDNTHDNYGARLRALFVPKVTGNWRLFMSTDDNGQLWFNPNGSSPSGRQLVASEAGCCGLYSPPGDPRTSPAFPLVAGQGYYLELLYKEGTGGDLGMVAARLDGLGIPTGGNDQGAEAGETISSTIAPSQVCTIAFGAVPVGAAGGLAILTQPAGVSTEAVTTATFSVQASAPDAPFICYQWQRSDDGIVFTDIPGAIRSRYTTPLLSVLADNGDHYRVVVGIPGASIASDTVTLTVTEDVTSPAVTVVVSTSATKVSVLYSEPIGIGAASPGSYTVNPSVPVLSVAVNTAHANQVDLTLASPMTLGQIYELAIQNVTDPTGNQIHPSPTVRTFRAQIYPGDIATVRQLPVDGTLPIGALTDVGMLASMVQVGFAIANDNAVTEQMLAGTYPNAASPFPNIAPLPLFIETGTINYNRDMPAGPSVGQIMPDVQFPGYPPSGTVGVSFENMAMEVVTYLELIQGVYRMGVSSDDGFRVTPSLGAGAPGDNVVLGEYNGGRGVADSFFDFLAPVSGLYPFRLIWEQGQGGANLEWWIQDLNDNTFHAVNSASLPSGGGGPPPRGPRALVPPCTPKELTIVLSGINVVVSWDVAMGGNQFQLQQTSVLASPSSATVWTPVPQTPQNQGGRRSVTIPIAPGAKFFRLIRPGPPCS